MTERRLPSIRISERAQRILRRYVGYPLFFVFSFMTSAYLTFPYDRVRDFITAEVSRALPGAELEIVSLEPSWVSGVELEGVSLRIPSDTEGERPHSLTLPRVWARAGIFAYLFGTTSIDFEIEVDGGGLIEGSLEHDEVSSHVVVHLEEVDLRRIGPLRAALPLPLSGVVGGDIDVTLAEESDETVGTATLTITDTAIGDGRARLALAGMGSGITIERASLGTVNIGLEIEHGTARIEELSASGDDAELRGSGSIRLSRQIRMWAPDLLVRLNVLPTYRDRNPATQAIFSLLDMTPAVREYRAADGAFQLRIQGTFGGRMTAGPAGSTAMPD
jgi:type II secretion system protein N